MYITVKAPFDLKLEGTEYEISSHIMHTFNTDNETNKKSNTYISKSLKSRAVKRLIFLIALIARLIFLIAC